MDQPVTDDIDVSEQETPETPEEETPEARSDRLERENQELKGRLDTFQGVIDEIRQRPVERIIERERPRDEGARPLTEEQRSERNARLAMALATEPDTVLAELETRAERRSTDRIIGEVGDVAADAIIDRFIRKASDENPILAPKIEPIFRREIDKLGSRAKTALLRVPAEEREALLMKEYKAAAADYLMPLARPKVKPGVGTDTGGRGAGEMPERTRDDGKFRFTPSQRESMRRAGMDDKKIDQREKAIQAGVA